METRMKLLAAVAFLSCMAALAQTPPPASVLESARARVEVQSREQRLSAQDGSQAVATLENLVAQGVPVDKALAVVSAAINDGLRGQALADIAKGTNDQRRAGLAPAEAADRSLAMAREKASAQMGSQSGLRQEIASPARGAFGAGNRPGAAAGAAGAGSIPSGAPAGVPAGRP